MYGTAFAWKTVPSVVAFDDPVSLTVPRKGPRPASDEPVAGDLGDVAAAQADIVKLVVGQLQ